MTKAAARSLFTGWHFLAWMLGSFVVVLVANFALIYTALTTHSGDVAHGAPPAGLRMMQMSNANVSDPGWTLSMTNANGVVHFVAEGAPHLDIAATVVRPGDPGSKGPLDLTAIDQGMWRADLGSLGLGQWDIEVELHDRDTGRTAMRRGRLVLP